MATDLTVFLKQNVEGYLLEDIAKMKSIRPDAGKVAGGVGYPLVMTVLSGIELFGALLSTTPFKAWRMGETYFVDYWGHHLYVGTAAGAVGAYFYQLVRHGLAHAFMTKGAAISVGKGLGTHLSVTSDGGLYVDAEQFAVDFETSYWRDLKPLTQRIEGSGPNVRTITDRLNEMLNEYEIQAQSLASVFAALPRFESRASVGRAGAVNTACSLTTPVGVDLLEI